MARFRRPRVRTVVKYVRSRFRRPSFRRFRGKSKQMQPIIVLLVLGAVGFIFKDKITAAIAKLKG